MAEEQTFTEMYRDYAVEFLKDEGAAVKLQKIIDMVKDRIDKTGEYEERNPASVRAALWNLHETRSENVVKDGRGTFLYAEEDDMEQKDEQMIPQILSIILDSYEKAVKRVDVGKMSVDELEKLTAIKRAMEQLSSLK